MAGRPGNSERKGPYDRNIFLWPGVGRLAVDSIGGRDYPVVQGIVLLSALSFMTMNLIVDVLYAFLDPRIKYQ